MSSPQASTTIDLASRTIAYFSMEIALSPELPTYSGGLGMLAGDTLRSAADMAAPMVAVSLAHRRGYFRQHLDSFGQQTESDVPWSPEATLPAASEVVAITMQGREVLLRAWRFDVVGVTGHIVPVFLLDADVEGNDLWDRRLTDHLYGGDTYYRLCQETILGLGGVALLNALGATPGVFHMNEGHAALLTVALLEVELAGAPLSSATDAHLEAVRRQCVFTTHTPVPAGHDQFGLDQMFQVLGHDRATALEHTGCLHNGLMNMTYIALRFSRYVNGVAMQHGIVSQEMFPGYLIHSITNGVHAATWLSEPFQQLLDAQYPGSLSSGAQGSGVQGSGSQCSDSQCSGAQHPSAQNWNSQESKAAGDKTHIPAWRTDNQYLRSIYGIAPSIVAATHREGKLRLLASVAERSGHHFDPDILTLGFARRVATYKRASLLFHDSARLVAIAEKIGGLQILFAGKAHPADAAGKGLIRDVFNSAAHLNSSALKVVYLENYDWELGAALTQGVDVWVNTPRRPYEASGTSGMKAALNGIPSLSILDGWWIEGCAENTTGWAIEDADTEDAEAASLYDKLEHAIAPMYANRQAWAAMQRHCIGMNGTFFNTHRMLAQYFRNSYQAPSTLPTLRLEAAEARVRETVLA